MKTYLVGGACRDLILGREPKDRDYVVVGGSEAELKAAGFEQVGVGFPVFIHPETGDEYALARREKKISAGYNGFTVETDDVTLEEDLSRRDLTMNSIAMAEDGTFIDPFGGIKDLKAGVLRHTSDAFIEDPLRVIRLARFYARYEKLGFTVAPETLLVADRVVASGELDALPAERFWLEITKAFADENPGAFFEVLKVLRVFEKVKFFRDVHGGVLTDSISMSKLKKLSAECVKRHDVQFSVDLFYGLTACDDAGISNVAADIRSSMKAYKALGRTVSSTDIVKFLGFIRSWTPTPKMKNFGEALRIFESVFYKISEFDLRHVFACVLIARQANASTYKHLSGKEIGEALFNERVQLIEDFLT